MNIATEFAPPCESPIEEYFAWGMRKYLDSNVSLRTQFRVSTICGDFRLDFVAIHPSGYRVAYECDGAEFHDASRDEWRDAIILGEGHVDAIIRIPGAEINFRLNDALYIASTWDRELFSDRGRVNLQRLASRPALRFCPERDSDLAIVCYRGDEAETCGPVYLRLFRTVRVVPQGQRRFWQTAYSFAKSRGGGNLDEVIATFRQMESTPLETAKTV